MRTTAKKLICVILTMLVLATGVPVLLSTTASAASNWAAKEVVRVAQSQVGYRESGKNVTKYGSWYGAHAPWCAIFVSWCVDKADDNLGTRMLGNIVPKTAGATSSRNYFSSRGRYYKRSSGYDPKPGDFIYFNWQSPSGKPQHIGIVVSADSKTVYTVEGNASDRVKSKSYSLSSSKILGYAHPNYASITGGSDDTPTTKKQTTTKKDNDDTTTKKGTSTTKRTTEPPTQPRPVANPQIIINTKEVPLLPVGKTVTLKITLRDVKKSDSALTWSSSNESVATVSQKGVVTAVRDGETIITAKTVSGLTAKCRVIVKNPTRDIYLNFSSTLLFVDETISLVATTVPENTTDTMTWTSSDEEVAMVDATGVVTGIQPGEAIIMVTTSSGKSAECLITVEEKVISIIDISLDREFETMNLGDTLTLTATIDPTENSENIYWSSSNEEIVTVSDGIVTAVGGGSATVTISSDSGVTATCIVTVKVPTKEIYFNENTLNLTPGQIYQMIPVRSEDETTDIFIWSSSDPNVIVVSPDGEVIAKGIGTATIKVETSGGASAECTVNVI